MCAVSEFAGDARYILVRSVTIRVNEASGDAARRAI
jgi:hypothetical protein